AGCALPRPPGNRAPRTREAPTAARSAPNVDRKHRTTQRRGCRVRARPPPAVSHYPKPPRRLYRPGGSAKAAGRLATDSARSDNRVRTAGLRRSDAADALAFRAERVAAASQPDARAIARAGLCLASRCRLGQTLTQ